MIAPQAVSNRAILIVGFSAVLWGLYWIPVLLLNQIGMRGIWAAFFLTFSGLLASLLFLKFKDLRKLNVRHWLGALGIGSAFVLYGAALSYTDVVRVVLLFYLAPAWSTIIECCFFGRRFSWQSVLGLALTFLGIVVIFRGELPLDGLGALGDWLAVVAGLGWSIGSALMFSSKTITLPSMNSANLLAGSVVALVCLLLLDGHENALVLPTSGDWIKALVITMLFGFLYIVPVSFATVWGLVRIPPALMSFLLTIEVIAAVASSAIFLDVQFGWIEALGTCFILSGAVVEVIVNNVKQVPD